MVRPLARCACSRHENTGTVTRRRCVHFATAVPVPRILENTPGSPSHACTSDARAHESAVPLPQRRPRRRTLVRRAAGAARCLPLVLRAPTTLPVDSFSFTQSWSQGRAATRQMCS